jgi:general stress protein 26
MNLEKNHAEVWEYIKDLRVGMLTTSTQGFLNTRPMFLVQEYYEGVVWLFADKDAAKVDEIETSPHVNLSFASLSDGHYAVLSGFASVHHSGAKFDELWSDEVKIWFANAESPKDQAALIRIEVNQAEIWDTNKGILKKAFEFAKAKITGKRPDLGENKTLAQ